MLEGPEKIEISGEQLENLKSTYKMLTEEIEEMIHDFFKPFDIMRDSGIFTGTSADKFTDFCHVSQLYLELQFDVALTELHTAITSFEEDINEANSSLQ